MNNDPGANHMSDIQFELALQDRDNFRTCGNCLIHGCCLVESFLVKKEDDRIIPKDTAIKFGCSLFKDLTQG